jgi:hypothetical protein
LISKLLLAEVIVDMLGYSMSIDARLIFWMLPPSVYHSVMGGLPRLVRVVGAASKICRYQPLRLHRVGNVESGRAVHLRVLRSGQGDPGHDAAEVQGGIDGTQGRGAYIAVIPRAARRGGPLPAPAASA